MMVEQNRRIQSLAEAYVDITDLSDKQLDAHISLLRDTGHTYSQGALWGNTAIGKFGVTEIISLLQIAVAEKNSRSAAKQAKASIELSRETKALAEASLRQSETSTKLSRWAIIVATVGVVATVVNVGIAIVGIWQ